MNQELEQQITSRWPSWFDIHGSIQRTLMPFGFAHGVRGVRKTGETEPRQLDYDAVSGTYISQKCDGLKTQPAREIGRWTLEELYDV
jgi:hypothetical protein